MLTKSPHIHIILPERAHQALIMHCRLALASITPGGTGECKAFGLLSGTISEHVTTVAQAIPLQRNVRSQPPYKEFMDKVMAEHAIPSLTPLNQRGWVADPAELLARVKEIRQQGHILLGTYHMHRVAWPHDSLRDTPTKLDTVLAKESQLLMFIVSMVEPARPIIRVFHEGIKAREIPVQLEWEAN